MAVQRPDGAATRFWSNGPSRGGAGAAARVDLRTREEALPGHKFLIATLSPDSGANFSELEHCNYFRSLQGDAPVTKPCDR